MTRIPLQAVRRIGAATFAAVRQRSGYRWQMVELGAVGATFAEVRAGLQPGDAVIADPEHLPAPPSAGLASTPKVAWNRQG